MSRIKLGKGTLNQSNTPIIGRLKKIIINVCISVFRCVYARARIYTHSMLGSYVTVTCLLF